MRKYLLAAAATAALSCFAAPAMAQCTGEYELTLNPDGTTTCGDPLVGYTLEIVPEAQAPYTNPFMDRTAPPGATSAVVQGDTVLWLDASGAVISAETTDSAPGDGVWEPAAYNRYNNNQGNWELASVTTGGIAAGYAVAAGVSAPTGAGPAIFGGIGMGYAITSGASAGISIYWKNKADREYDDWRENLERCTQAGNCTTSDTIPPAR
jgi:hypothetical protein